MKEKIKVIIMLFITIEVLVSFFATVNAHSIDLDPNSVINFPIMITKGQGTITVEDIQTEYTLYYQAVEISNTDYDQMLQTKNTGEQELENIKDEANTLSEECENLKTIFDEAAKTYIEKLDGNVTGTELEEAETAYETAKTNYLNKVDEYNSKADEYNTKAEEFNAKIKELTPGYIEENWIETEDGSFSVDISQFSGNKAFAMWVKLVTSDGTIIYDQGTYMISGTKVESIEVEGISLDRTILTLQEGSSYTLTAVITPADATNKSITWTSDNENVATVSNGRVVAKSSGTATITATTSDGMHTATCKVTVVARDNNNMENDNTVATIKLPNAGMNIFIVVGILAMIVISIISYKIYASYKDVK